LARTRCKVSDPVRTSTFAFAMLCVSAHTAAAQQQRIDSAFLRRLVGEAVAAIPPHSQVDTVAQSVLLQAARIQVGLNDLTAALRTAAIASQTPGSKPTFDRIARNTVCYLLEDRDLPRARRAAENLARLDPEMGEWTRAHFAVQLNRLPRAARKSLRTVAMDTAALTAESMIIAASLKDPAVAADTYLSISSAIHSRDGMTARRALRSADSARRLVPDRSFAESRQAMIAFQAFKQRDDSLAFRLAGAVSDRRDVQWLAVSMALTKRSTSPTDASRETLVERIVRRSVDLAARNPDRRIRDQIREHLRGVMKYTDRMALADLVIPEGATVSAADADTVDTLMSHAQAALKRGDMKDVERWVDRIRDPRHVGIRPMAWYQLAYVIPGDPALSRRLHQRAVDLLANERPRFAQRDDLLQYIGVRVLMAGHNEEAVSIVNRIDDPKEARYAIRDMGQSTLAHLDAPKLRRLADELRSREVRDQVLFRLMISMLLVRGATPQQAQWGLALADSIHTRDLQLQARIEAAKFLKAKGDSAASKARLLSVLNNGFDELSSYDRDTVLALLASVGAGEELLEWARRLPPLKRAQTLVAIVPLLQLKLPRSSDERELWISNAPDPCREEF
jgi:hypothetical protein